MEALVAFSWHRCDTKPNLEIANHAVAAAKASGVVRSIASAVWCLGQTYAQLGDLRPFYKHVQQAYRLFNTLPLGEVESRRLGGQCGIDLVDAARFALLDMSKAVSLARDVEMKCATLSNDLVHGRSLVVLGIVLCHTRRWKEALCYLDQARTMLEGVGNIYNLAGACQAISWVHYDEGRLPAALDAMEEAWKYAELTDSPSIQASISLDFGKTLFSANSDTEAWKHIEIALMKASYIGDQFTAAQALEYTGYGYLRRGDYQNAFGAYQATAEKYFSIGQAYHLGRCKENMTRIKWKEENTDMTIGFHRPGVDVNQTLFYPPHSSICK
jgi:tetratricopeptide (TPR) repeat protein